MVFLPLCATFIKLHGVSTHDDFEKLHGVSTHDELQIFKMIYKDRVKLALCK